MTVLDVKIRQKAYDAVQKYGKEMTFYGNASDAADGDYNPDTGEYETVPTVVEYLYKSSPPTAHKRGFREMDNVQDGDMITTLPALNLNATFEADALIAGMKVKCDAITFIVVSVEKIYSGEQIAAYNLQLRARGT